MIISYASSLYPLPACVGRRVELDVQNFLAPVGKTAKIDLCHVDPRLQMSGVLPQIVLGGLAHPLTLGSVDGGGRAAEAGSGTRSSVSGLDLHENQMGLISKDQIDFIDTPSSLPYECPLDVHCTYSQRQLLVALDYINFGAMRQGVLYLPDKKTDVFLITLNKSDKEYSPTTMYNDYAVNSSLFHWQSQSTTSADSPTGQRYIHHKERSGRVLLFVRELSHVPGKPAETMPYTFLGEAEYVSHNGSKPMNIVWRLRKDIPAKYLRKTMQVLG